MALTDTEIELLDKLTNRPAANLPAHKTLSEYLLTLACLGGYLARAHDPPPGNLVIWRGLRRLTDIQLGYTLGRETCG